MRADERELRQAEVKVSSALMIRGVNAETEQRRGPTDSYTRVQRLTWVPYAPLSPNPTSGPIHRAPRGTFMSEFKAFSLSNRTIHIIVLH